MTTFSANMNSNNWASSQKSKLHRGTGRGNHRGHGFENNQSSLAFPSLGRSTRAAPITHGKASISPPGRPLGRGSLIHRTDVLPSGVGYSMFSRPMLPIPGQGEVRAEWKDLSRAPPAYQMQQFYGGNVLLSKPKKDAQNAFASGKASDTDICHATKELQPKPAIQSPLKEVVHPLKISHDQCPATITPVMSSNSTVAGGKKNKKQKWKKIDISTPAVKVSEPTWQPMEFSNTRIAYNQSPQYPPRLK